MKYAIIDIGSNSVRLMLWADGKTLYKRVCTTRLAEGLSISGQISSEAALRTALAVEEFCEEGRHAGAEIFAFATAAVRSARNGAVFCELIKTKCGITVDVISGKDEALLGACGALDCGDGGIVDIGGASTEVCFRKGGKTHFSVSIDVGAVRLYEICKDDPTRLTDVVSGAISPLNGITPVGKMYAIGGTSSTLASVKLGLKEYDRDRLQNLPLEREWVNTTAERLLSLSVEERKKIAGMDSSRADVIAGAAFLLAKVMNTTSCAEVYFSDRDNLEGYLEFRRLI